MKNLKGSVSKAVHAFACAFGLLSLSVGAATATVTQTVTHYPWNGMVDVTFTMTDIEEGATYRVTADVLAGATTYAGVYTTNVTENMAYSFSWDAAAAGFRGRVEDAKVVLRYANISANYAVIDVSSGSKITNSFPVTYLATIDDPNVDDYKTDKILLKNVGGSYVGVFEVTQRQYERVTGETPAYFLPTGNDLSDTSKDIRDEVAPKRPVERVSFATIMKDKGFISNLVERTKCDGLPDGLPLSLPTAEQWESAARGQMPSDKTYNLGANGYQVLSSAKDAWLAQMGRYIDLWDAEGNLTANGNSQPKQYCDANKGTAIVGSYGANDNGLYDMHGNVAEWTLEDGVKDDEGLKVAVRYLRGGSWQSAAADCAIGAKMAEIPDATDDRYNKAGFRLFSIPGSEVVEQLVTTSAVFKVDVATASRRVCVTGDAEPYTFTYIPEQYWTNGTWRTDVTNDWISFEAKDASDWVPVRYGESVATNDADDTVTATFDVAPLAWEGVATNGAAEVVYDKTAHTRTVSVTKPAIYFEITYGTGADDITLADPPEYTDVGTYTNWYKLVSLEPGAFYPDLVGSYTLTITPKPLADSMIKLDNGTPTTPIVYSGMETNVAFGVETAETGVLEKDTDYAIEADSNVGTDAGTYRVIVNGLGNYSGSATQEWTIAQFDFDAYDAVPNFEYTTSPYVGCDQTNGLVSVTAQHPYWGEIVFSNEAWTVSNNVQKAVGDYWVFLYPDAESNFTGGPISNSWSITVRDIAEAEVTLGPTNTYTGAALTQTVVRVTIDDFAGDPAEGVDYVIADNVVTNAGDYTLKLIGINGFAGSTNEVAWTVRPRDLSGEGVTLKLKDSRVAWTGEAQSPTLDKVTVQDGADTLVFTNGTLAGIAVTALETEAGRYTGTVTGSGNFTGTTTATVTWEIAPNMPAIYPNNGTEQYAEIADWITVSVSNMPPEQAWNLWYTTNDWETATWYNNTNALSHKFDLDRHAIVQAYAVSADEAVTSAVARCEYFFGSKNPLRLETPNILLVNPQGEVTNRFRYTGDRLEITNSVPVADPKKTILWPADTTVRYAIVPNSTDKVNPPAASAFAAFVHGTTQAFFKADTNVVWAIAEADNYLPSTNAVLFVRQLDAIGKPTVTLDNGAQRKTAVVTMTAPEGANAVYYTYAITSDATSVPDPVGDEYDQAQRSDKYTAPFNVQLEPGQTLVVKARAYFEDATSVPGVSETSFTARSAVTTNALTLAWQIADALDAPDQCFEAFDSVEKPVNTNVVEDTGTYRYGNSSMVIKGLANNERAWIATEVVGPGTVTFDWKTRCEKGDNKYNYDHFEFSVNGAVVCCLDGDSDWTNVSYRIDAFMDETVTIRWTYVKDDSEKVLDDAVWLDHFTWTPGETQLVLTDTLCEWALSDDRGFSAERIARLQSSDAAVRNAEYRTMLAEDSNVSDRTYYECYVLGLDPEGTTDFEASDVTVGTQDGVNVLATVSWTPCTKAGRIYSIVGKKEVTDVTWTTLNSFTATADDDEGGSISATTSYIKGYRYFQLEVRMAGE